METLLIIVGIIMFVFIFYKLAVGGADKPQDSVPRDHTLGSD